jgi:CheY-like chemotaxis protein
MGAPDLQKLKVMVADDEPKLRELVASCARSVGCQVVEAKDGDEAWDIAQRDPLDLVILDVMMPGMSGWEVCRRIKVEARSVRGTAPKVLMLTGIGEHLNEMTSPLFAADDWVDKPFELDTLREKIQALGEAALSEEPVAPPPAPSGPSLKKARPTTERLDDLDEPDPPRTISDAPPPTAVSAAVESELRPTEPPESEDDDDEVTDAPLAATVQVPPKKAASKDKPRSKPQPRPAAKKAAPKKAPPKAQPKKKAAPKKAAPKKAISKKAQPKKAVAKKAQPKKAVAKKAQPKKAPKKLAKQASPQRGKAARKAGPKRGGKRR